MLRRWIALVALFAVVSGCQKSGPSEPSKMHHVLGALQIRNPKERDAALAEACREAAEQGEGPVVLMAVPKIENKELRDTVANECSETLNEKGATADAQKVAELITDEAKRAEAIKNLGG